MFNFLEQGKKHISRRGQYTQVGYETTEGTEQVKVCRGSGNLQHHTHKAEHNTSHDALEYPLIDFDPHSLISVAKSNRGDREKN